MKILVLRAVLVSALLGLAACAAPQESVDAAEAEIGDANFSLASWNLEFFGSTTQGEVEDDALQVRNAATVIGRLNPDVIGLQEIVDSARWAELKSALPAYEGVLATDPIVEGDWSGARRSTSRPALLVKRDRVVVRGAKLVPEIDAYLRWRWRSPSGSAVSPSTSWYSSCTSIRLRPKRLGSFVSPRQIG